MFTARIKCITRKEQILTAQSKPVMNLTSRKTEPELAARDMCSSSRVRKSNLQARWPHPRLLKTVKVGHNNGIKMGDNERSKCQTVGSMIIVTTVGST